MPEKPPDARANAPTASNRRQALARLAPVAEEHARERVRREACREQEHNHDATSGDDHLLAVAVQLE